MTKRRKFIFTALLLSAGFLGMQLIEEDYRFLSIAVLSLLTLVLFFWSLKEGIGINATLVSVVLPCFFTVGVGLFWFLLPSNIFTRVPILIFYGVGIYALCLTMNIYTVSAIRSIALLRAARGVGFVLTLVTAFLLYDAILSLRLILPFTSALVGLVSLPILLQGYWSIPLEVTFSKKLLRMTLVGSLVLVEVAASLFFWPVSVVVGSLFLTVTVYVLLGLGQAQLESRLFKQTVREYLFVGAVVFFGMFLATKWGG